MAAARLLELLVLAELGLSRPPPLASLLGEPELSPQPIPRAVAESVRAFGLLARGQALLISSTSVKTIPDPPAGASAFLAVGVSPSSVPGILEKTRGAVAALDCWGLVNGARVFYAMKPSECSIVPWRWKGTATLGFTSPTGGTIPLVLLSPRDGSVCKVWWAKTGEGHVAAVVEEGTGTVAAAVARALEEQGGHARPVLVSQPGLPLRPAYRGDTISLVLGGVGRWGRRSAPWTSWPRSSSAKATPFSG